MVQHDKSTENLDQAIGDIKKTCQEYMGAVSKALALIGSKPEKINHLLNEIEEHKQMIISMCQKGE